MADAKSSEPVPLDTIPVSPNGPMTDATNGATNGDKVVTVFDDPANFNVKHQLQHVWTLWFTKPPNGKQDWNELLKEVISFNSVEEFWGIYVCHMLSRASASKNDLLTSGSTADSYITEQYHPCFRARAEIRLPPLQIWRATRVGGPAEQAWWTLALHFQKWQGE
jgi:hypothetical protein